MHKTLLVILSFCLFIEAIFSFPHVKLHHKQPICPYKRTKRKRPRPTALWGKTHRYDRVGRWHKRWKDVGCVSCHYFLFLHIIFSTFHSFTFVSLPYQRTNRYAVVGVMPLTHKQDRYKVELSPNAYVNWCVWHGIPYIWSQTKIHGETIMLTST